MNAPLLVTMGDCCGIGPEAIVAAHRHGALGDIVVIGDPAVIARAAAFVGHAGLLPEAIADVADLPTLPRDRLAVLSPPGLPAGLTSLPVGRVSPDAGAAAARCIEHGVELLRRGVGAALLTAPIHKEALFAAGVRHPGHTEMLQALAAVPGEPPPPVRMMLANDELRTVLVTVHVSLRRAIEAISAQSVLETLRIAHRAAMAWGDARPRIAVAGLNPHAGEGGLFGDEEIVHIAPAVRAARAEGIDASGPYAPDTVFMRARRHEEDARTGLRRPREFDIVVAMTHDHGLIPVKYLGVENGVNVTLGLPFVRTSPDHGTAFDIAGRGVADPSSLISAAAMARRLSAGRSSSWGD